MKTYTFALNLENMHENFSHWKKAITNINESPTFYFVRNFNPSYIYNHESWNNGEAGRLLESFRVRIWYRRNEKKYVWYEWLSRC